ncbi:MAG: ABC transporter permease [Alphaproteobacteria bacterium]|nr:ABC transporter permease [Alphaproteobacteria bacterium]
MADLWLQFVLTIDATLRVATPLILCAMAGLFSERSGIIDISLEGKMLMSAFAAASMAALTGSPLLGLAGGILVSVALSLIHGFACITHKGNQVISGLAINILASGLTVTLGIALFAQGGQTPFLNKSERFTDIVLPFAEEAEHLPVLGTIYKEIISGHNLLVWVALFSVIVTGYVVFRTRFGLRLRAVGEKPEAVDSAGVSVSGLRFQAVIIAGILCGIAGTYLSTAHGAGFIREMAAGKGYIALAARLQGVEITVIGHISTDLILVLPYLLTVILLAGFIGKASPPRSIGVPYIKER